MARFSISIEQLAEVVGGTLQGPLKGPVSVAHVATDTRRLPPRPFAFLALRGPNFDGHDFVREAVTEGACCVVIDDLGDVPAEVPAVCVSDGLEALQRLASWWREQFVGTVVAVTGSNGKTIVKEMVNAVASPHRRFFRSPGSFNSQIGVALSILRAPSDASLYVFECGVSKPGEMAALQQMTAPDIGVLTTIGTAHLEGFGDRAHIAREKLSLFADSRLIVAHVSARPFVKTADLETTDICWVGEDERSYAKVVSASGTELGQRVTVEIGEDCVLRFDLHSHAVHDAENAACSAALAVQLGFSDDEIEAGLCSWVPSPWRIEVHTTPNGVTLINDSYSADPLSTRSALRTLVRLSRGRRAIAVLGAMHQLGNQERQAHLEVGREVAQSAITDLIAVGPGSEFIVEGALAAGMKAEHARHLISAEACAQLLTEELRDGDVVLVKASRLLHLERTAETLLESLSASRVYIDLDAIADNVRLVRRWVGDGVRLIGVVKSFGYGSDAVRVSEVLEAQGVDYLAVAYPDEGALLRRRGIQAPILVMGASPQEAQKIVRYRMAAVVYTRALAERLDAAARAAGTRVAVHVKLDTGMQRFGLPAEQLAEFLTWLEAHTSLYVEGVMSHLAVADEPREDEFTRAQIRRFSAAVEASGYPFDLVHIANSAGILRFPEARLSAVRMGLALYGCIPDLPAPPGSPTLRPAIRLHSRLIGIREVPTGQTIGYGRAYRTAAPTRIGLVGLGYNDGLPWSVSNRGALWVRGARVPIVGRVCMDVTLVDLSGIPSACVGDDVVVYGTGDDGEPTVPEVADWAGTIPYEILCRISSRVRRIVRFSGA